MRQASTLAFDKELLATGISLMNKSRLLIRWRAVDVLTGRRGRLNCPYSSKASRLGGCCPRFGDATGAGYMHYINVMSST